MSPLDLAEIVALSLNSAFAAFWLIDALYDNLKEGSDLMESEDRDQ